MARLAGPEVEAALSELYDRYSRTVYGVGLKILGERSLAEELAQDVFLKVWRSYHSDRRKSRERSTNYGGYGGPPKRPLG